ncbi:MAG TPA: SMP-30/gluconolactonase/LRE family protein [Acidimicrobiales bacterium]|nr:SMP-30/gluconolactonase/LRE family protein [Acidimicrobiales bacterium]
MLTPSAGLAEGPVWDWTRQMLLWIDMDREEVYLSDIARGTSSTYGVGTAVGSVFLGEGSHVFVAGSDGLYDLDLDTGKSLRTFSLPLDAPRASMNDGEVDPIGRVWAGTMSADRSRADGALYRFDRDGTLVVLPSVKLSNGLGWSPDQVLFYFVDSATQRIDVFDYDRLDGAIYSRRPFVTIPPEIGIPDGVAVDSEGCVWVAIWGGGMVHRYTPEGELDAIVKIPTPNVSSCCFGGRAFDTLFVTTSTRRLASCDPNVDGTIYACQPQAVGMPARRVQVTEPLRQEGI